MASKNPFYNLPVVVNKKPTKSTKPGVNRTAKFTKGHCIQQHVKVYLTLKEDGSGWELDPVNDDGFPLDGLKSGPTPTESDCDCTKPRECVESHNWAGKYVELPNGKELFAMLVEFYTKAK